MIRTLSNFSRIHREHGCMEHTTDVPRLESSLMWFTVSMSSRGRSSIRSTEGTARADSSQARRSFLRRCLARSLTGMSSILKTETWWVTREEASVPVVIITLLAPTLSLGVMQCRVGYRNSLIGVCKKSSKACKIFKGTEKFFNNSFENGKTTKTLEGLNYKNLLFYPKLVWEWLCQMNSVRMRNGFVLQCERTGD